MKLCRVLIRWLSSFSNGLIQRNRSKNNAKVRSTMMNQRYIIRFFLFYSSWTSVYISISCEILHIRSSKSSWWIDEVRSLISPELSLSDMSLRFSFDRYLFVLQLKDDIRTGKLDCPSGSDIELAALSMQGKWMTSSISSCWLHVDDDYDVRPIEQFINSFPLSF